MTERQINDATLLLPECPTCGPNPGPECPWRKSSSASRNGAGGGPALPVSVRTARGWEGNGYEVSK